MITTLTSFNLNEYAKLDIARGTNAQMEPFNSFNCKHQAINDRIQSPVESFNLNVLNAHNYRD